MSVCLSVTLVYCGQTVGRIRMKLSRGLTPYQVASASIQPFGHNRHGPKIGGCYAPFWRELGPRVALAEAYLRTKWHLDPSRRLATIDIGRG